LIKKIDKLVLRALIGPFLVTFSVVVFIFLLQFFLGYINQLIGKDLGFWVYARLIFYFALTMTPIALPLAILLSCLITFGNLGEHMELTAIKSSGISLIRVLTPMFLFACLMAGVSLWFNDSLIPKINLKAWSLFYDVRQKKPAVDLKEGVFYNGLPNISIRVDKKWDDGRTLEGMLIYDHSEGLGNNKMVIAKRGYMETINSGEYLKLTLLDGSIYSQKKKNPRRRENERFSVAGFEKNEMLFGLESFKFKKTDEELFKPHRVMNDLKELNVKIDSFKSMNSTLSTGFFKSLKGFYSYMIRDEKFKDVELFEAGGKTFDLKKFTGSEKFNTYQRAITVARNVKGFTSSYAEQLKWRVQEKNLYSIEKYKKYTNAFACIVMFFIGAPLGSIIKKGGLGVPVLVSIIFFITYYVLSLTGEKLAKQNLVEVPYGMWGANFLLMILGLWFLTKARQDSALLDADFYTVKWQTLRTWLSNRIYA
jgi:lipopolysaccharide export system permease protein